MSDQKEQPGTDPVTDVEPQDEATIDETVAPAETEDVADAPDASGDDEAEVSVDDVAGSETDEVVVPDVASDDIEASADAVEASTEADASDAPSDVAAEEAPARRKGKGKRKSASAEAQVEDLPVDAVEAMADAADDVPNAEGDDVADSTDVDAEATDAPGDGQEPELFDPSETENAPRAPHPLKPVVEALIFASPEPLTVKAMTRLLEEHPKDEIEAALVELRAWYDKADGLQLVEVAGGYQIVTRPELYEWVRRLFKERTSSKLSVQALETLAVIAYKQPVTSAEIAEIRGVSATTGVLSTLLDRSLVKIVGRKQVVGRPFMYGTTREFLDKFGLKDLSDLPKVEDMSEALGFDLPTPVDELGPAVALPFDELPVDDDVKHLNEAAADDAQGVLLPVPDEGSDASAPEAGADVEPDTDLGDAPGHDVPGDGDAPTDEPEPEGA